MHLSMCTCAMHFFLRCVNILVYLVFCLANGVTENLIMQATWRKLVYGQGADYSETLPSLPSRLVTEDDLKEFYEAMKIYEVPKDDVVSNVGIKRKSEYLGGLDTQQYGRGKRTREVYIFHLWPEHVHAFFFWPSPATSCLVDYDLPYYYYLYYFFLLLL